MNNSFDDSSRESGNYVPPLENDNKAKYKCDLIHQAMKMLKVSKLTSENV